MKKMMKMIVAAVLATAILCTVGYAVLIGSYTITNTMSIKGVNVQVLAWIDDTTPPTTAITTHDWGTLGATETAYFINLCVKNTGTQPVTLSFSTTLPAAVGAVTWQIEKANPPAFPWANWATEIASNTMVGSNTIPLAAGAFVGNRPASPNQNDAGHIRIMIVIAGSPPTGTVAPFDITITGTEKT